jgi:hypothetical protein
MMGRLKELVTFFVTCRDRWPRRACHTSTKVLIPIKETRDRVLFAELKDT